jgi:hypothetical protein
MLNVKTFKLPFEDQEVTSVSPSSLMVVAAPKIGKSTIMGILSRDYNALILDFEKTGYDKISCKRVKIESLEDLKLVARKAVEYSKANEDKKPYEFVVWDSMTEYQEMCEHQGTIDYMQTPQGKHFNRVTDDFYKENEAFCKKNKLEVGNVLPSKMWKSVTTVTSGRYNVGSQYIRNAFKRYLEYSSYIANKVIYVCHVRDKFIGKADDPDAREVKSTSLQGQIGPILAGKCDACGFIERNEDEEGNTTCVIDFTNNDEISGSRYNYLEGKKFEISKKTGEDEQENAIIEAYWQKIFRDLND